ncbi:hypothetical protein [Streptomyces sp. WM6378]|uniref:hypothetical protein n=1 Tax=Streptomyces sp. WM6378 TaxID=1415557 RepID=UPI00131C599F|nr:hypothetical protein [Streptomyces sp. WM6378]
MTGGPAPGAAVEDAGTPVNGPALEHVPLPVLFDDAGKVSPQRAEAYLTAVLTNSGSTEIAEIYGYTHRARKPAMNPGIGIIFHNGARLWVPFLHTTQPGHDRGRSPFRLQASF